MRCSLTLWSLLATSTHAFWRMSCPGRLALARLDPIVSPGTVAAHVHTISGGSGFGADTSYEQQRASACSSCPIKQDLSVYWTPKLYYMAQNGTFEDVPQAGEQEIATGGMTVYYQQRTGTKPGSDQPDKILAFPPGLRMLAGNPLQRNATGLQAAPGDAVSFVCLNYRQGSSDSLEIPNKNCPDGLRAQIYFPSCWDGVNNDTADHRSHMAYPIGHYDNGYCPDTHPVHLVSIFFEVIYSIDSFSSRWYNSDGSHPFVFSSGDRTGYGFHGDFVNGWDTNVLQQAVDECDSNSGRVEDCPAFNKELFTSDECKACMLPASVDEKITGSLPALPGCNTPSSGPELATPAPANCIANNVSLTTASTLFQDVTKSLGWAYQGCANDDVSRRTFQGASEANGNMTVESCLAFCREEGYSLAGLEYASQCYCDNDYHYDSPTEPRAPVPGFLGLCGTPCAGDEAQVCGGAGAMSVYRDCKGAAECTDVAFEQFPQR